MRKTVGDIGELITELISSFCLGVRLDKVSHDPLPLSVVHDWVSTVVE